MTVINFADIGVMTLIAALITVCVRNLANDKKSGICSCGKVNCSGCPGCKAVVQRRQ